MEASKKSKSRPESEPLSGAQPRVVYTQAPVQLGELIGRADGGWLTRIGTQELIAAVDAAVDPELLEEAAELGARVLVDASADPTIVGVVQTSRYLRIDRDGNVTARVRSFAVDAAREVLLKTRSAYVRVHREEVELYGNRVLARAREIAKVLGRLISLN